MTIYTMPDAKGKFGDFGGRFIPELLMPAVLELEKAYDEARQDPEFLQQVDYYLKQYVGRETPLYDAERLTEAIGGAKIFLKREIVISVGAML